MLRSASGRFVSPTKLNQPKQNYHAACWLPDFIRPSQWRWTSYSSEYPIFIFYRAHRQYFAEVLFFSRTVIFEGAGQQGIYMDA